MLLIYWSVAADDYISKMAAELHSVPACIQGQLLVCQIQKTYPSAWACTCSLFEVLGHGKDSTVYKGRRKQTICYCAIKRVPKSAKACVLQEVGSSCLQHYADASAGFKVLMCQQV